MVTAAVGTQPHPTGSAPVDRRAHWPWRAAVTFGTLGTLYRLVMLLVDVPPTNSDEATMGLAALHVAEDQALPIFFYGQYYMGTLEAYLAAPLFLLAGASTLALRLPLLAMYVAFLVVMWRLTSRLYTPWLAAVTVGLLALGSDRVLKNQVIALGGYPEMNPAGALLVLLAVNLGLGLVRRRALAYAAWGVLAGLMLWVDWLLLPYLAVAGLLLLVPAGRRPSVREFAALLGGGLLGAGPLLAHNLTAPWEQNSINVLLVLNGGAGGTSLGQRLDGAVLFGVPMGTGLCSPATCSTWQLWWGWCYPVLLVAAGVLAVRAIRRANSATPPERAEVLRQAGRLALVVAAALTIFAYVRHGGAAVTPGPSSRYLSCLLISTPAVLWPLWSLATRRGRVRPALRTLAAAPLAALAATMLLASALVVAEVPTNNRVDRQRRELVEHLRGTGVTRFYTEYWTCNVLVFLSREDLRCAVIGEDLRPGQDRYLPYRDEVLMADRPAYVLPAGSQLSALVGDFVHREDPGAVVTTVAGYDIYQPTRRLPLPLQ